MRIKKFIKLGLIKFFLSILVAGSLSMTVAAAEPLKEVRIASIAIFVDGKNEITGGQSAVIAKNHLLEAELKKRGIELQWYPVPTAVGGPIFNEALAKGEVDFASYGDFPAIIAKSGGIDIKLIVPSGRGTNSYLVVPTNSTAQSLEDLKGKRVSIHRGRPLELTFSQLLRSKNLKYSDFKLQNINSQAGASALAAGSVDALFTGSDAYQLQDKGVGRIIWSTKGTDWKWRAELFVRREFAEKYPEITQLVANAYVQAAYWSAQEENRSAVIDLATRIGTPRNVIERDYSDETVNWKDRWSPLFDDYAVDHYREAIAFTREQNLIRRDFPVEDLFDRHFVDAALKQLQLENYWKPRAAVVTAAH